MRKLKDYNEDEVCKTLSRKHDIKIDQSNKKIEILNGKLTYDNHGKLLTIIPKHDLGNTSLGKIDFLVNYRDYNIVRVPYFTKPGNYKNH
jgi:hypothetical protein